VLAGLVALGVTACAVDGAERNVRRWGQQDDSAATDSAPPDSGPSDSAVDSGDSGTDDSGAPPEPADVPARYPADRLQSPITPYVRDLLASRLASARGRDANVFMKVGDSITVDPFALGCFADDDVGYGDRDELEATVDHFLSGEAGSATPWDRESRAAEVGETAAWAMEGSPSPVDRELSALSPAFAVLQYGTNDMQMAATYKDAIWPYAEDMLDLVDHVMDEDVIPVLVTIPPRLDDESADTWVPIYNAVVRGIAQGRQVPLVDLELGLRGIDGYGLYPDGVHLEPYSGGACRLGETGLSYGCNMRNLLVLDGLDRLRRAAIDGESFDGADGLAIEGAGTASDPVRVAELPFTDLRDTRDATDRRIDRYDGCGSSTDESGPEVVYRIEFTRQTTLRALLFDRGSVDVDLHVLGDDVDGDACLERDDAYARITLDAGVHHVVVDTYGGDANAGEYLVVLTED
jgi:hypothetical protein